MFKINELFKGSCENTIKGANVKLEYTLKHKLNKFHSTREIHCIEEAQSVDIVMDGNDAYAHVYEGIERNDVKYVNISLTDMWIRMPQKTLEALLENGESYLDEQRHKEQEEDLASEND